MSASHFVRVGSQVYGPFALEQLASLRDRSQFQSYDEISEDGQTWRPAWTLLGMFDFDAPHAQPVHLSADTIAATSPGDITPTLGVPRHEAVQTWTIPHRGSLILVLGLISMMGMPPLGIFAWVMGSNDLHKIRSGIMDPSGESITQAGYICGIIGSVLTILTCAMPGFLLLLVFLAHHR